MFSHFIFWLARLLIENLVFLIFHPLYTGYLFNCGTFYKIFFNSDFWAVWLLVSLFLTLCLCSLGLFHILGSVCLQYLSNLKKVSNSIFCQKQAFSLSPTLISGPLVKCILDCLFMSHRSLRCWYFSFIPLLLSSFLSCFFPLFFFFSPCHFLWSLPTLVRCWAYFSAKSA